MTSKVDLSQLAIEREPTRPRIRRRPHVVSRFVLPLSLVGGFFALLLWAGWGYLFPAQSVTVVPVLVSSAHAGQAGTPLFKAAGWIEPRPTPIRVAALAPGVVESLLVVEDQAVQAGEPVAELIKEDARLAYDRSRATLKLREAALKEAQAVENAANTRYEQPVHLQAALGEASAALAAVETEIKNLPFAERRAQADLEFARRDHQRKVAAGEAVAGSTVDQARSRFQAAQAMVEELQQRAVSLEAQHQALVARRDALETQLSLLADEIKAKEGAAAQVEAAAAQVEQARVAVAEAKLRLDRMTVRAPIAGRVYQLVGYPGSTMTGGMRLDSSDGSTVVTLYRPEMLQARVDVRFEDIPKVSLGQTVEINNPALAEPIVGRVLYVSSEADIQKNTLEAKVAIDSPPGVLKPEMLVDATFLAPQLPETAGQPDARTRIFVPQRLVRERDGRPFVWVADQSEQVARMTPIEVGQSAGGGMIEVTAGLKISSRLITGGADNLADGDPIRITGEQTEAALWSHSPQQSLDRLHDGGNE
jgi:HlyD family secretion protein